MGWKEKTNKVNKNNQTPSLAGALLLLVACARCLSLVMAENHWGEFMLSAANAKALRGEMLQRKNLFPRLATGLLT